MFDHRRGASKERFSQRSGDPGTHAPVIYIGRIEFAGSAIFSEVPLFEWFSDQQGHLAVPPKQWAFIESVRLPADERCRQFLLVTKVPEITYKQIRRREKRVARRFPLNGLRSLILLATVEGYWDVPDCPARFLPVFYPDEPAFCGSNGIR